MIRNPKWGATETQILLLVGCLVYSSASSVNLNTKLGNITGTSRSFGYHRIHKYLGIPYAKPPVGDLRFAKPQPYGPFSGGNLNATSFGCECAQISARGSIGNEDCLFLNVYAPASASKLAVIIWTHGGSFISRSGGNQSPDFLTASQDVVVVTINYRLGVFGFLGKREPKLLGNYALWDQKMAIQWVKDNIAEYGGDPSRITIFGQSAGAFMVTCQMASLQNDATLFQRAITDSGSALSLPFLNTDPSTVANKVIGGLKCEKKGVDLLTCLRSKSANEILATTVSATGPLPFAPNIDNDFLKANIGVNLGTFLEDGNSANLSSITIGNFAKYDLFSGWNNQEGLFFMDNLRTLNKALTGKNLSQGISAPVLFKGLISLSGGSSQVERLTVHTLINYYMNTPARLTSEGRSTADRRLEVFAKIAGDFSFKLPTVQHLQLHSLVSTKKTFAYEFTHKRNFQGKWFEGPDWLRTGANHEDELPYVFGYPLLPETECRQVLKVPHCGFTDSEAGLSVKMMKAWSNFAKYGNPGFRSFHYPRYQAYTQLDTGHFRTRYYPLGSVARLGTALNGAALKAARP